MGLKIREKLCVRDENLRVSVRVQKSSPSVYRGAREIAIFKGWEEKEKGPREIRKTNGESSENRLADKVSISGKFRFFYNLHHILER